MFSDKLDDRQMDGHETVHVESSVLCKKIWFIDKMSEGVSLWIQKLKARGRLQLPTTSRSYRLHLNKEKYKEALLVEHLTAKESNISLRSW